jgi:predicted secreted protein
MAYTDRFTGRNLVVNFTPSGGSLHTVTGDQTAFSLDRSADTVDVTAGSQQDREFLTTLRGVDWSMSIFGGNDTNVAQYLKEGTAGLLEIYPRGNTAGMPKIRFNGIVTGFNMSYPFDGAVEYEISGIRNGSFLSDIPDVV